MRIRSAATLLLLLLSAAAARAQLGAFRLPITITDSGLVTKSVTLTVGIHPDATVCLDAFRMCGFNTYRYSDTATGCLAENEAPPDPPAFYARFTPYRTTACPINIWKDDIRKNTGVAHNDTFRIRIATEGDNQDTHAVTIAWPANIGEYADSALLMSITGLPSYRISMATQSSFKIYRATGGTAAFVQPYIVLKNPNPNPPATPDSISAIFPLNGATGVALNPTLSWNSIPGGQWYRVQVDDSPTFAPPLLVNDSLTTTTRALSGLQQNKTYYWRVVGANQYGISLYQDPPFSFTTLVLIQPPRYMSPDSNGTGVSATPTLVWHAVTTPAPATGYHVQLDTSAAFTTPIINDSTVTDTTLAVGPLLDCYRYYWRVRSKGASAWSAYGSTWPFRIALATPATPVLLSPADGATNVGLNPTLSWRGDKCSDNFRLEVSLSAGFASLEISQLLNSSSSTVGPLLQDTVYYWRVKALNALPESSAYSAVRSFRTALNPPAIPVLLAPANNATGIPVPTQFSWRSVPYASTYDLQVDDSPTFSAPLLYEDSLTVDTVQTVSSLFNCRTYYWRVRARNASGSSAFAAQRLFSTAAVPPAKPRLLTPAADTVGFPEVGWLTWAQAVNDFCTNAFVLVVTDSATGAQIVRDTTTNTSRQIGPLGSAVTYFWRVGAIGSAGSSPDSVRKFKTTAVTTPFPPVLASPANGIGGLGLTPTLCWDTSARATSYRLQVSLDSVFTLLVVNDSTLVPSGSAQVCKQVGPLLNSRTYYWRVSAKNIVGASAFSPFRRFSTLSPPPPPNLVLPGNGATGVDVTPTCYWTLSDGASSYRLEVAKDTGFTQRVFDDSSITQTSWTLGVVLKGLTRYYWRVTGRNSLVGWGTPSSRWSFTTTRTGAADWAIPIAASETGPARDTVWLGIDPLATFGIDPGLDEFEIPAAPPGWYDLRFIDNQAPSRIGDGLRVNIHPFRSYSQIDTFRVKFQTGTGTYPVTLSWPSQAVRDLCDSMLMKDEFGGLTVRARMDQLSSVSVTNPLLNSLLIVQYGAFPVPVAVGPSPVREVPKGFTLSQNFPNPFNPTTRIEFSAESYAMVDIRVYDVLGREVAALVHGSYEPGFHAVEWDGRNDRGEAMPSGVYYARMLASDLDQTEPFVSVRKMLMMR